MTFNKRTRERMLAHCGEIHADDGIDPRDFFRPTRTQIKENRKAQQLCRQVAETLAFVLSGETPDEVIGSLQVLSVVPAPDASRLLVTLRADTRPELFDPELIECRLCTNWNAWSRESFCRTSSRPRRSPMGHGP
jgi:ribosome-binding factor A